MLAGNRARVKCREINCFSEADFWDSMALYVGQWKCGCTQALSPERVLISRYGGLPWDRGGWPSSQECSRRQLKLRQAVR
jgi:hypothetical protein